MRLIDADALLKEFSEMDCKIKSQRKTDIAFKQGVDWVLLKIIPSEIDNAPTIDAIPIVHAHWIGRYDTFDNADYCECSVCKRYYKTQFMEYYYCPNCGAKMDEEE